MRRRLWEMKPKKSGKPSESEQLSLKQAAAILGVTGEQLLALLEDAGLPTGKGPEVRVDASEVYALRRQREKEQQRNEQVLSRLAGELDEVEGPRAPQQSGEEEGQ